MHIPIYRPEFLMRDTEQMLFLGFFIASFTVILGILAFLCMVLIVIQCYDQHDTVLYNICSNRSLLCLSPAKAVLGLTKVEDQQPKQFICLHNSKHFVFLILFSCLLLHVSFCLNSQCITICRLMYMSIAVMNDCRS